MRSRLRSDVQDRLCRFFESVPSSRATTGDPVLAAGSTIGPFRDDNEDRAATAIIRFPQDTRPRLQLAIVCDGMGGLVEGGWAASEAMAVFIATLSLADEPLKTVLLKAVGRANQAVFDRLQGRGGTTLTAVITNGKEAWCAHVGDSRLYAFGPSGLVLLTHDDTIQGAIHAHEGQGSEDDLDNRLLQFVGIGDQLAPHVFSVPTGDDHLWIVTSDGAHGIGRRALELLLEGSKGAHDVVKKAIFVADALNVKDNASVAVMRHLDSYDREPAQSGVSISVSSPVRNLELWLAASPLPIESGDQRQNAPNSSRLSLDSSGQPEDERSTDTRPKRSKARKKKAKLATKRREDHPPMEVLFESKKADDSPT